MKLNTKTKEFDISIIGIASVDGGLRFEIQNPNLSEVFATFTNPEETAVITHDWGDGNKQTYKGYTRFKTVDIQATGSVVVALLPNGGN